MANARQFTLPSLEVEVFQMKEVMTCLLHTIVFHRALGTIKPREVDSELFDVTWVSCGDRRIEREVAEKVSNWSTRIEQMLRSSPDAKGRLGTKLCISFYTLQSGQQWFGRRDEKVVWEQWTLGVIVPCQPITDLEERDRRKRSLEEKLVEVMDYIVVQVANEKEHIPPVRPEYLPGCCFPFEISRPGKEESLFDTLKNLWYTNPPMIS
eukprot:Rmarinus@m.12848